MALVPRLLRPSVIIRRKAMYSGVLGPSSFWKIIAIWVFGKASLKKFFGKHPEVIDVSGMGAGRYMQIITAEPMTRRKRRKLAKKGVSVPTLSSQREMSRAWAAEQDRIKRAS